MSKLLTLILLTLSLSVQAKPIAYFNNQAGGKIVLTDEPCTVESKTYKTYSTTKSSDFQLHGCWLADKRTESIYLQFLEGTDEVLKFSPKDLHYIKYEEL
jgi:hypothetical protein